MENLGNDVADTFNSLSTETKKLVETIKNQVGLQTSLLEGLKAAKLNSPKSTSDSSWYDIFDALDTKIGDLEALCQPNGNGSECKDEANDGENEKQVDEQTEMEMKKNYLRQEFQFTMKAISKMEITLKSLNSWYKDLDRSLVDENVPEDLMQMLKQLVQLYDAQQNSLATLHSLYDRIHNYFEIFFTQNQNFETFGQLKANLVNKMEQKTGETEENGIVANGNSNGNLDD